MLLLIKELLLNIMDFQDNLCESGLKRYHNIRNKYEIGIDEVGRGPMFGRLYVAGVILPKDDTFLHKNMKDSKKIHSHKKMTVLAEYIKEHAIAWHIHYEEAAVIDTINIRQSVLQAMKECAKQIMRKMNDIEKKVESTDFDNHYFLIIDGNDFPGYMMFDEKTEAYCHIPHITVEQGDNNYTSIAAASIIAKQARDEYILILCEEYPDLKEKYVMHKNMGYGTKDHIEGIKQWGITKWHRRSFGICKTAEIR